MDLDKLGQWPILQLAAAMLLIGWSCFAIWRGVQDSKKSGVPPGAPTEARWFFDGPLNIALTYLRDIAKHAETMARELQQHGETLRQHTKELEEIGRKLDLVARHRD